jgi:hypothetical protein
LTDIPVKPHRKTLLQTAVILNVTAKTVRRYLDNGKLSWSGNQVSVTSIELFLQTTSPKDDEPIEGAGPAPLPKHQPGRRIISRGI